MPKHCFRCLSKEQKTGLVGLDSFSGTDFGGKFAGIGKIKWLTSYWNLEEDSDIIQTFINLGEQEIDPLVLQNPRKKFL